MPSSNGVNGRRIAQAVKDGNLNEAVLNKAVERLLEFVFMSFDHLKPGSRCDMEAHHRLARRAASESAVLLKNERGLLPLKKGARIAVVGAFAKSPRYQGSGSSLINPWKMECAWDQMLKYAPDCVYAPGYRQDSDRPDEKLIAEACEAAKGADAAVVFAGLTDEYESEGFDREHMRMPESHNELIRCVAQANKKIVVVLMKGAPVEMPWAEAVPAILDCCLGGQAVGGGAADVLFGAANPSGKLAETVSVRLEDALSSKYFLSGPATVEYRESVYVGYRWFDKAKLPVRFPFGHGLSYTSFEYSGLSVDRKQFSCADGRRGSRAALRARCGIDGIHAGEGTESLQENPAGAGRGEARFFHAGQARIRILEYSHRGLACGER
jgi:beta-glucosidase